VTQPPAPTRSCFGHKSGITRYTYIVRVIDKNRSVLLERAARVSLKRLHAEQRESRDLEIINRNAERLNREGADTMEYQRLPRNAASST
jgi:hypothetical protein